MNDFRDWRAESELFDQAAARYDRFRPSYPSALIDQVMTPLAGIASPSLLEIGAGSGKATALFVARGCQITCIEPGEQLARIGAARFQETGQVRYVVDRFERWQPDHDLRFDLVLSAQAFHWIPEPEGYLKSAEVLRPGGHLALFWNRYAPGTIPPQLELAELLRAQGVLHSEDAEQLRAGIEATAEDIASSGCFAPPDVHRFPWSFESSYAEFVGFLGTGSGFLRLDASAREALLIEIERIFAAAGGSLERSFVAVLYLARVIPNV